MHFYSSSLYIFQNNKSTVLLMFPLSTEESCSISCMITVYVLHICTNINFRLLVKLYKAPLHSNQVVKSASCVIDLLLMRSQTVLYYEVREESGLISALICLVWD